MTTKPQSGTRRCAQCGVVKPLHRFFCRDAQGRRHRTSICRKCQGTFDELRPAPGSPWERAEREVERRYGVPAPAWLNRGDDPLTLLHTALAVAYAAEAGVLIPHTLTVGDCELLCDVAGYHRLDEPPHQEEDDARQHGTTEDHAAA